MVQFSISPFCSIWHWLLVTLIIWTSMNRILFEWTIPWIILFSLCSSCSILFCLFKCVLFNSFSVVVSGLRGLFTLITILHLAVLLGNSDPVDMLRCVSGVLLGSLLMQGCDRRWNIGQNIVRGQSDSSEIN